MAEQVAGEHVRRGGVGVVCEPGHEAHALARWDRDRVLRAGQVRGRRGAAVTQDLELDVLDVEVVERPRAVADLPHLGGATVTTWSMRSMSIDLPSIEFELVISMRRVLVALPGSSGACRARRTGTCGGCGPPSRRAVRRFSPRSGWKLRSRARSPGRKAVAIRSKARSSAKPTS